MIGTRGAPALYGGFETAVEEIGARLAAAGHEVTVYCRNPGQSITSHRGMRLVNLTSVRRRGLETLSHTALSMLHANLCLPEVALVFNAGNAPLIPMLRARGVPVAVNVDGVEWRREKWGPAASRYYRAAERAAVRWADALIADARGIQRYYADSYGAFPVFIPYGAPLLSDQATDGPAHFGLDPKRYHLVVARFEPENNLPAIIQGFQSSNANCPLVVVGNPQSHHPRLKAAIDAAAADQRIIFTGGVWEPRVLDQLYAHALTYVHGHSVGGTNPSLLRAMGAGAPTIAFDVCFNREVLGEGAAFFATPDELAALLRDAERSPDAWSARAGDARDRVATFYNWDLVAASYESLCQHLATGARVKASMNELFPPT